MNDTNSSVETRFNEMMMKKSGQERLKMGFSMFNITKKQVMASIKMNKPDANNKVIRTEIFLRFYGEEFSPEARTKILLKLR